MAQGTSHLMPELPDVEGYRRYFRRYAAGKRVASVEAEPDILRNTTLRALRRALTGHLLAEPKRHGKWLICPADGSRLLLHFGMTGDLVWSGAEPERHRHDRLVLGLEDGELRYRNMRKLGGVWLVRPGGDLREVTGPLGPDALRVPATRFVDLLRATRGGAKAALMDQHRIAGLGNITVDEILWRARIDPRRKLGDLGTRDLERIERTTKDVLRQSIADGRIPTSSSWLTSRRGTGEPTCPRCGTLLERHTVAGRTTYLCPACQE